MYLCNFSEFLLEFSVWNNDAHISFDAGEYLYFLVPTLLTYSLLRNRFFSWI